MLFSLQGILTCFHPPSLHQPSVSRKSWVRSDLESPSKAQHLFALTWLDYAKDKGIVYKQFSVKQLRCWLFVKNLGHHTIHRTQASSFTIFVVFSHFFAATTDAHLALPVMFKEMKELFATLNSPRQLNARYHYKWIVFLSMLEAIF